MNPNVAVSRQSRDDLSNKDNRYIFICCNDDEADTIKNSVKTAINEYNIPTKNMRVMCDFTNVTTYKATALKQLIGQKHFIDIQKDPFDDDVYYNISSQIYKTIPETIEEIAQDWGISTLWDKLESASKEGEAPDMVGNTNAENTISPDNITATCLALFPHAVEALSLAGVRSTQAQLARRDAEATERFSRLLELRDIRTNEELQHLSAEIRNLPQGISSNAEHMLTILQKAEEMGAKSEVAADKTQTSGSSPVTQTRS